MGLDERLRARIEREGPLPFHDVMEAALYDPDEGYYSRGPAIGGAEADFATSVSFPAFRDAIARLVERARAALSPAMRVVELGAGTGELARGVLERVPDVEYVTVERSAALRARQRETPGVRAVASPWDLAPAPSLVLGNEVLDALPVRRVVGGADGEPLEVHVDVREGRFRERLLPLRDADVRARLAREGRARLPRGQIVDVAPALEAFVRDAARLADPGFLVLVDYGDVAERLFDPSRLNGTLAVYRSHGRHHDPYEELGRRDLTADVDFTAVERAALEAGMEPLGLATQGAFLEALGVDEREFVAKPTALGTAFLVFAARRGTRATLPGFG